MADETPEQELKRLRRFAKVWRDKAPRTPKDVKQRHLADLWAMRERLDNADNGRADALMLLDDILEVAIDTCQDEIVELVMSFYLFDGPWWEDADEDDD